jgi:hypothetical protein
MSVRRAARRRSSGGVAFSAAEASTPWQVATSSVNRKGLMMYAEAPSRMPRDSAPYAQLYLDTYLGQSIGGALNEAVVDMFAGQASPQDIVDALEEAVAAEQ